MKRRTGLALGALASVLFAGCHRKPPIVAVPPPPQVVEAAQEEEPAPEPPPEPAPAPPSEPAPEPPSEPASPRLLEDSESLGRDVLAADLERADRRLGLLEQTPLTEDGRSQLLDAAAFIEQARQALQVGDLQRATVLVRKANILLEDVERSPAPPER